jgi:hypothetical protein
VTDVRAYTAYAEVLGEQVGSTLQARPFTAYAEVLLDPAPDARTWTDYLEVLQAVRYGATARKVVGYGVLASTGPNAAIRKALGYAVLDARTTQVLQKAVGYAVLLDATIYGYAGNTLGPLGSTATGNAGAIEGTGANTLAALVSDAAGLVANGAASNTLDDLVSDGLAATGPSGTASSTLGDLASEAEGFVSPFRLQKVVGYAVVDSALDQIGLRKGVGFAVVDSALDYIGLQKTVGFAVLDDRVSIYLQKTVGYVVLELGPVTGSAEATFDSLISAGTGTVTWPPPRVRTERLRGSQRRSLSLNGTVLK